MILPVPLDRTTSYVPGTRNGPREILQASSHMELWDEEVGADVHPVGLFTLPEMELPFGELTRRVATDPHPGRVEHGRLLDDFTGGAVPVTDSTAADSPLPPPSAFR